MGQILLVGQITAQRTKVNSWGIQVTKLGILSFVWPNDNHLPSFVDLILTLEWVPLVLIYRIFPHFPTTLWLLPVSPSTPLHIYNTSDTNTMTYNNDLTSHSHCPACTNVHAPTFRLPMNNPHAHNRCPQAWPICLLWLYYLTGTVYAACNEIGVRLTVIQYSNRAQYEPTVGAWYALVPLAGRSVLLGACSWVPSQEVLLCQKVGWQHLRDLSAQGSTTGCPASMPNLARPWRLCPGMTQGLATWGPTPAG